jgi:hypothetical protein
MKRVNYTKLVSPDTFIGRYLSFMSAQETAHAYDFWTAVWLLGASCGRGVVVNRPRAPVYLNWFILLVADSGVTRKSTAVRVATSLVQKVLPESTELITTKTTPENLEMKLHDNTRKYGAGHAVISISELVTFLGQERYNRSMPGLLTDLYDCAALRAGGGTIARGPSTVRDVFVSFLSATTPAWLTRAVNPDVVEGGFTSRCMFVHSEKRKRSIAWPADEQVTGSTDAPDGRLCDDLQSLAARAKAAGSIRINEGALRKFTQWYNSRHESRDPFRASFESREDAHVLRLAACLCINDETFEIQDRHIVTAIRCINEVKEDGASIFAGGLSNNQLVLGIDKLRDLLIQAGTNGLQQSALTVGVKNFMPATKAVAALLIMHELEMVQRFEGVQLTKGRPATVWRATNRITARNAMDLILQQMEPE